MAMDNNRLITLLIIMNIVTLTVVGYLVGLLFSQRDEVESHSSVDGRSLPRPVAEVGGWGAPREGSVDSDRKSEWRRPEHRPEEVARWQQPDEEQRRFVAAKDLIAVDADDANQRLNISGRMTDNSPAETLSDDSGEAQPGRSDRSHRGATENETGVAEALEKEVDAWGAKVDVYRSGNMVRIEQVDERGNTLVSITNGMEDAEQLAAGDRNYLMALNELKDGTRSHVSMNRPGDIKRPANPPTGAQAGRVNYYNKVNMNERPRADGYRASMAAQIEKVVSNESAEIVREPVARKTSLPKQETPSSIAEQPVIADAYVRALKEEHRERANEMRALRVEKGDSLWRIAEKVYGNGLAYKRLIRANPQLSNPDLLRIGDLIRVPL